jgi:microcystin degradation protein MlrC
MRVLVGRLFHESNSFNPIPTRAPDFTVLRGAEMLDDSAGSTLGGILRALRKSGAEPVPTLSAMARPGGPVEHRVYADLKAEILAVARAERADAAAFELHGAMTTELLHDVEGDLVQGLRDTLGPAKIIGIGLDLHAHVTPAMLAAADIVTACKENPHADVVEAGERTARFVLEAAAGRLMPVTALVKLPMLLRGGLETTDRPLADLHARARNLLARYPDLVDISICNAHSYLDVPGLGQALIAIANINADAAQAAVMDLATEMWRVRDRFNDDLPSLAQALDLIAAQPHRRPWVVGDRGDRVLAGAPGDSNVILRHLLDNKSTLRTAIPITDADAVTNARRAGVGARIRLTVGGRITPGMRPVELDARVSTLGDGRFVMRGPYQAGQPSSVGPTAVIEAGGHNILLTTLAGLTQDPAAFTSQGIDIAHLDLIVVKSGYHFKLSFAGLATPLVIDTPGLTNWRPGLFAYRHARRCYPEDDVHLSVMPIEVFKASKWA